MLAFVVPSFHSKLPPAPAPLAVSMALSPLQMSTLAGEIDAVGFAFTVTVVEAVAEHEPPSVTVTV